jgi:hypothetical protein
MLEPDEDLCKVLVVDIKKQFIGLTLVALEKNYLFNRIVDFNIFDITTYTHNNIDQENCSLFHTRTYYDWSTHMFQEHLCFDEADIILLRRQSTHTIEQLIFGKYRKKTYLISSKNINKFFSSTDMDETIRLYSLQEYKEPYQISGICMLLYWINKMMKYNI